MFRTDVLHHDICAENWAALEQKLLRFCLQLPTICPKCQINTTAAPVMHTECGAVEWQPPDYIVQKHLTKPH